MKESRGPRDVRALLERARCRALPFGVGWRVVGQGVDLLVADLRYLRPVHLIPFVEGVPRRDVVTDLRLDRQGERG